MLISAPTSQGLLLILHLVSACYCLFSLNIVCVNAIMKSAKLSEIIFPRFITIPSLDKSLHVPRTVLNLILRLVSLFEELQAFVWSRISYSCEIK